MKEIRDTEDLARIRALPRRKLTRADMVRHARELTPLLRCRGANVELLPAQGAALAEARAWRKRTTEPRGLVLGYPVGTGKTLIYELLPHPEILNAKRPVLIISAQGDMRAKTQHERRAFVGKWQLPRRCPTIVTREELALEKNRDLLKRLAPDLIMIDESDTLSNFKSAACRRIHRYLAETDAGEHCRVVVGTGTLTRKSILGYWHHLLWALREDMPAPMSIKEAKEWAACIDLEPPRNGMSVGARVGPGPLGKSVDEARAWWATRLEETPGVILLDEDSAGNVPLTIETTWAPEDPELNAVYETFLTEFEVPDGDVVTDPLSRWRLDQWLGSGLHEPYIVPPPEEWRMAARGYAQFVRDTIDHPPRGGRICDTAAEVSRWYADAEPVQIWQELGPTFEGRTRADWLSDSVVQYCAEWLDAQDDAGIPSVVWCGIVEFGERLAQITRRPYYGAKGKTMNTPAPGLYAADPSRSMIASWNAGMRGFNLQPWRENLLVQPPQSAKYLEQLFGRAHRRGAKDPVRFTILLTSGGTADAFEKAIAEARFAKATTRYTQKILRANIIRAGAPPSSALRWARQTR